MRIRCRSHPFIFWRILLVNLFVVVVFQSTCITGNPPSTAAITTPIRAWEPSWVASSAQGTSLVVSCQWNLLNHQHQTAAAAESGIEAPMQEEAGNNCVLLLTRSAAPKTVSSSLQWKPPQPEWQELKFPSPSSNDNNHNDNSLLRISEIPMDAFLAVSPFQSSRTSWSPLGTGAICAMTGLAPDVDHVSSVIQKMIHGHRQIYDSVSFPTPAASTLVKLLAETVSSATRMTQGRPYGFQALVVGTQGLSTSSASYNEATKRRKLFVYTVDPSGAWRHWGSGCSAIGRNAEEVRQHLYELLYGDDTSTTGTDTASSSSSPVPQPLNPRSALEVAMKAVLQATRAAFVNQDSDQYEAVLFWVDPASGQCRIAMIDPQNVRDCRDKLWESLQKEAK